MTSIDRFPVRIVDDVAQLPVAELDQLAEMHTLIERESDPVVPAWTTAWTACMYPRSLPTALDYVSLLAYDGSRPIGRAQLAMDNTANVDAIEVDLDVHPEFRRQGVGTSLIREAMAVARIRGRTNAVAWGVQSDPASAFWAARGFGEAYVERSSLLQIAAVDWPLMQHWVDAAQPARDAGYRLTFWPALPDDGIDDVIALAVGMADAPLDDLAIDHATPSATSLQEWTRRWSDHGSERWSMIIHAPDGRPAAITGVLIHATRPHIAWQRSTTTLAEHRNRGLGRWVKAAMMQRLHQELPELEMIDTENAESNRPMLNLNEEMGYVPDRWFVAYQASVDDVS